MKPRNLVKLLCAIFIVSLTIACSGGDDGTDQKNEPTPEISSPIVEPVNEQPSVTTEPEDLNEPAAPPVTEVKDIEISFAASAELVAKDSEVTLSWKVSPANAKIVIEPDVGDVTELTKDGEGSTTVKIAQDTTFTLTATLEDGSSKSASVTVKTQQAEKINLVTTLNGQAATAASVFKGESVELVITSDGDVQGVKLQITDPSGTAAEAKFEEAVVLTVAGQYTITATTPSGTESTVTIQIGGIVWEPLADGNVLSVAIDNSGKSGLAGLYGEIAEEGQSVKISVQQGSSSWSLIDIDLIGAINGFTVMKWDNRLLPIFKTFPIEAVASDGGTLYAGSSGLLLYSKDGGASWHVVDTLRQFSKGGGENGSHATCNGENQGGVNSTKKRQLIGVRRVCDIAIAGGRVILAYDQGVVYNDNIGQHIADPLNEAYLWHGAPIKGEGANEIYGNVVNDLELNKGTLLAATGNGVWKSEDNGASWAAIGLDGENVYSVLASENGDHLAGTTTALYKLTEGKWETVKEFSKVNAIGRSKDYLIVGTASGLFINRIGSETWSDITKGIAGEEASVRDIKVTGKDMTDYGIYIATSKGLFVSHPLLLEGEEKQPEKQPEEKVGATGVNKTLIK